MGRSCRACQFIRLSGTKTCFCKLNGEIIYNPSQIAKWCPKSDTPTNEQIKHIHKEGARYHVLSWDNHGVHCSEPNCEINKPYEADTPAEDSGVSVENKNKV